MNVITGCDETEKKFIPPPQPNFYPLKFQSKVSNTPPTPFPQSTVVAMWVCRHTMSTLWAYYLKQKYQGGISKMGCSIVWPRPYCHYYRLSRPFNRLLLLSVKGSTLINLRKKEQIYVLDNCE